MTTVARSTRIIHRLSVLVALSLSACEPEPNDNRPLPERLDEIGSDLTVGSAGSDVRALHEYLTQFGYFPNDALAKSFPRWRPAVSTPPTNESVFDERTAAAVRRLQVNMGVERTGIVDRPTRDVIRRLRCGVPDNMVPLDPSDKFGLYAESSGLFAHNWFVYGSSFANLSLTQVRTALTNASLTWMKQASITMAEANDFGATSAITFEDIGSFLGFTDSTGTIPGDCTSGSCRIRFSNSVDWTVQDFETVALHELGHALGMDHSASNPATMFPSVSGFDRTLEPDDSVAVSTLWDTYWQLPGAAIDIGVGANGMVWVLGLEDRPYRFNVASGDWQPDVNNITALRIAVDSAGVPCVTTSSNQILCRSSNDPSSGSWTAMPGAAIDVGIGANGEKWIVGPDQRVLKFDASINDWRPVSAPIAARRVAVSPTGKPWIVTTSNTVQSLSNNDPLTGTWQSLPGTGTDIGVGVGQGGGSLRGQEVFAYKVDQGNVFVWNEQPATAGSSGSDIPAAAGWRIAGFNRTASFGDPSALPAGPASVAVGPNGKPWFIGSGGAIYTSVR